MYNVTQLTSGTNIVEWSLVINSWTSGTLFAALVILGAFITFSIMRYANNPTTVCMMSTGFIWGIISSLLWVVQWQGLTLLPTAIPILFGILGGVGALMHLIRGGIGNI
jgi:hypothetical protein